MWGRWRGGWMWGWMWGGWMWGRWYLLPADTRSALEFRSQAPLGDEEEILSPWIIW